MMKKVKVGWVFWLNIERYRTNYYRKTRGANFFEFIWLGYRVSIGMPYHKYFVEYEVLHSMNKSTKIMERNIAEMLETPGFKIRMPKRTYVLSA